MQETDEEPVSGKKAQGSSRPGFIERTLKGASPFIMVLHLLFTAFMVKTVYFTNQVRDTFLTLEFAVGA